MSWPDDTQTDSDRRISQLEAAVAELMASRQARGLFNTPAIVGGAGHVMSWGNPLRTPSQAIGSRHFKSLSADDITAGTLSANRLNLSAFLIGGATWTNNSPSAGYVAWSGATVFFEGTSYTITNSNTNLKYIWWSRTTANTTFQSSNTRPTLTDVEFMVATNDSGTHDLVWNAQGTSGVFPAHLSFEAMASLFIYGDGIDGDVTISGNTTLTRDMSYNNLTVNNGVVLTTAGYRIFVKGTLTNNGTIRHNGTAATSSAGAAGAPVGNMGSGTAGGNGASGGAPGQGSPGGSHNNGLGGAAGTGGVAVVNNAPPSNGANTVTVANRHGLVLLSTSSEIRGGIGGSGGNADAGANAGGGGGGGGGVIVIAARTIANGSGTIEAKGGNGYNTVAGAQAVGGGGGGGGGAIVLVYKTLTQGTVSAAGGSGGTGANGGTNGSAGATGTTLLIEQAA